MISFEQIIFTLSISEQLKMARMAKLVDKAGLIWTQSVKTGYHVKEEEHEIFIMGR